MGDRTAMGNASRIRTLVLAGALCLQGFAASASDFHEIPPPDMDESGAASVETAVFAGGCFWGVQGVFQHVKGVSNAVAGYTGGAAETARYELVSNGDTGHAESVQVTFDPKTVSYGHLLQIYLSVAHDPTQLNRQGPDTGTQYRSAIFPIGSDQAAVARAYIAQLDETRALPGSLATKIEGGKTFYPAEAHHQNFLNDNPDYPYIAINDVPKVEALKRMFPEDYSDTPVLVPEP